MLEAALAIALFAAVCAVALVKPERVLLLAIFLAPWHGLDVDLGIRVTAFRLVSGALAAASVVRIVLGRQRTPVKLPGSFWMFLAYGVLLSLAQLPGGTETAAAGGMLRGSTPRTLIQIGLFTVEFGLIALAAQMISGPEWIRRAAKVYIASCVCLSILGWVQVGVWLATGWNPFPIGLVHFLVRGEASDGPPVLREGAFDIHGITILRMNAFGGEPKGLGTGLAVGLVILQVALSTGAVALTRRVVAVWLFLFGSLLATFATSGYVLWALGSLMGMLGGSRAPSGVLRRVAVVVTLPLLAGIIAVAVLASSDSGTSVSWWDVAMERTVGRDYVEDFDAAVGSFLIENPLTAILGVGLGRIHLYADEYLPDYAQVYAGGTAFTAKSGVLRLVSELGLVGLLLFVAWLAMQARKARRVIAHLEQTRSLTHADLATLSCVVQVSAMLGLMYLARGAYVSPQAFLTFALLASVALRRSVAVMTPARFPHERRSGAPARSLSMTR